MRAVIQRVDYTRVIIDNQLYSSIGKGLLVLLGIEEEDDMTDVEWLAKKIAGLRIFADENDLMNLSLHDIGGEIMVVSQFTLHASTRKGNRPSFIKAAKPEKAIPLYEKLIEELKNRYHCKVQSGKFGAMMNLELLNNGPVTILIDTKNKE